MPRHLAVLLRKVVDFVQNLLALSKPSYRRQRSFVLAKFLLLPGLGMHSSRWVDWSDGPVRPGQ